MALTDKSLQRSEVMPQRHFPLHSALQEKQVITKAIVIHSLGNVRICANISSCQSCGGSDPVLRRESRLRAFSPDDDLELLPSRCCECVLIMPKTFLNITSCSHWNKRPI